MSVAIGSVTKTQEEELWRDASMPKCEQIRFSMAVIKGTRPGAAGAMRSRWANVLKYRRLLKVAIEVTRLMTLFFFSLNTIA